MKKERERERGRGKSKGKLNIRYSGTRREIGKLGVIACMRRNARAFLSAARDLESERDRRRSSYVALATFY